jgi:ABC-type proline/glycine betaine transport system ATPase subunit
MFWWNNRALYASHEASIFLLDDPLSAVDPSVALEIFSKYFVRTLRKQNKTIIFVTHGMQVSTKV